MSSQVNGFSSVDVLLGAEGLCADFEDCPKSDCIHRSQAIFGMPIDQSRAQLSWRDLLFLC